MSKVKKVRVKVQVNCVATYIGELEMTQAEFKVRCEQMDTLRGSKAQNLAYDLIDEIGLSLSEPTDHDEPEVDTFEVIEETE